MKKVFGLLFTVLLFSPIVYGQGAYLGLEGGAAFPLGKFSANSDAGAGYAKAGFNGSASVGYKFSDRFSAGLRAIFAQNNPEGPNSVFLELNPWNSTSILAAAKTSQAITKDLYVEIEGNAGIMFLEFPAADIVIGGFTINREAGSGNAFAFGLGSGLKYYLADDFALKFGLHYIGAEPSYTTSLSEFSQRVDILLLNWGILFEL
ncbi:MAG: outer membrane beta-barrel protein [Bacteroidia bacterium]|nr:outer membrane beta-barrel protein [Bacteroidia bacterium]